MNTEQVQVLAGNLESNVPEILFGYLFGSYGAGTERLQSDIDIAVYLKPGTKTLHVLAGIITVVEETIPGRICDLTILNDAGVIVAMEAIRGRLLFVRDEAREIHAEFYTLTCRIYEDQMAWRARQLKYRGYEVQWSN